MKKTIKQLEFEVESWQILHQDLEEFLKESFKHHTLEYLLSIQRQFNINTKNKIPHRAMGLIANKLSYQEIQRRFVECKTEKEREQMIQSLQEAFKTD